ncbi:helix-turn-helix domain-containing protein [Rhodococcus sp. 24CO]|uniref:helix-turn-helix domain-containing protein n=1 Tax=Rhodococcus sp. 24CO TaxID=3117460 RepID=UPI003D32A74E
MATKNEGDTWAERVAAQVGGQVKRLRERDEWPISAQTLADLTAELGHEVKRSVIANLESGRRGTVTVADVLVLAEALRVPPAMLVFPLGAESAVEALPDRQVETWEAAQWWNGERPPLVGANQRRGPQDDAESEAYATLASYRRHSQYLGELRTIRRWMADHVSTADGVERYKLMLAATSAELGDLRRDMTRRGLVLPKNDEGGGNGEG